MLRSVNRRTARMRTAVPLASQRCPARDGRRRLFGGRSRVGAATATAVTFWGSTRGTGADPLGCSMTAYAAAPAAAGTDTAIAASAA